MFSQCSGTEAADFLAICEGREVIGPPSRTTLKALLSEFQEKLQLATLSREDFDILDDMLVDVKGDMVEARKRGRQQQLED